MTDDGWLKTAMTDDTLVVNILMQLNNQPEKKLLPAGKRVDDKTTSSSPTTLEWSVRNRRSKQVMMSRGTTVAAVCGDVEDVKGESTTRVSPTTPLSWSGGGTSVSGGAAATIDGAEECSRQVNRSERTRSKVICPSETTPSKRPRKKKTLVELKEEETLLLKERKHLQDELASLRFNVEKQRTTNESLKRIKFDMQSCAAANKVPTSIVSEHSICMQHDQMEASCGASHPNLPLSIPFNHPNAKTDRPQKIVVLPDLNLPCEDISNSDFLCTVR